MFPCILDQRKRQGKIENTEPSIPANTTVGRQPGNAQAKKAERKEKPDMWQGCPILKGKL